MKAIPRSFRIAAAVSLAACASAQSSEPPPPVFSREFSNGLREFGMFFDSNAPETALVAITKLKDYAGPGTYDLAFLSMVEGSLHQDAGRIDAARESFRVALGIGATHPEYLTNEQRRIAMDSIAGNATVQMAEPRPPKASTLPSLRLEVLGRSETRVGTGGGALSLQLALSSTALPPNTVVRRVVVTNATDNLARKLMPIPNPSLSPGLLSIRMQEAIANERLNPRPGMIGLATSLQRSIRSAESIQMVEGYVEVFAPSEENGGIVRIPRLTPTPPPGALQHPALLQRGIEFRVAVQPSGELVYTFKDPSSMVAGYQLQDAEGNRLAVNRSELRIDGVSGTVRIQPRSSVQAQLVIFLATPAAIEAIPFRVEDIPLP